MNTQFNSIHLFHFVATSDFRHYPSRQPASDTLNVEPSSSSSFSSSLHTVTGIATLPCTSPFFLSISCPCCCCCSRHQHISVEQTIFIPVFLTFAKWSECQTNRMEVKYRKSIAATSITSCQVVNSQHVGGGCGRGRETDINYLLHTWMLKYGSILPFL